MWDGGVEAGWKEGVEATWEGAVMIGWGPRCERGAQCHEDYMGAPRDNWAVVVFFLLYVSVHNSCRRVVFVWHSVFFVWHPSWPFHGVSTASPSACALLGRWFFMMAPTVGQGSALFRILIVPTGASWSRSWTRTEGRRHALRGLACAPVWQSSWPLAPA